MKVVFRRTRRSRSVQPHLSAHPLTQPDHNSFVPVMGASLLGEAFPAHKGKGHLLHVGPRLPICNSVPSGLARKCAWLALHLLERLARSTLKPRRVKCAGVPGALEPTCRWSQDQQTRGHNFVVGDGLYHLAFYDTAECSDDVTECAGGQSPECHPCWTAGTRSKSSAEPDIYETAPVALAPGEIPMGGRRPRGCFPVGPSTTAWVIDA